MIFERSVNWRHFADDSCPSCAHPSKVAAGSLCSEHAALAEAFVRGFCEGASRALTPETIPGGGINVWGVSSPHGRWWHREEGWIFAISFPFSGYLEAKEAIPDLAPWWEPEPWEVAG